MFHDKNCIRRASQRGGRWVKIKSNPGEVNNGLIPPHVEDTLELSLLVSEEEHVCGLKKP